MDVQVLGEGMLDEEMLDEEYLVKECWRFKCWKKGSSVGGRQMKECGTTCGIGVINETPRQQVENEKRSLSGLKSPQILNLLF